MELQLKGSFCSSTHTFTLKAAKTHFVALSGLITRIDMLRKQKNKEVLILYEGKLSYVLCKSNCYHVVEVGILKKLLPKTQLTCFNKRLSPVESWSVIVPFSVLSRGLARINAIQISTWVCKKLFHVYLKNMSWKTNSKEFIQTRVSSNRRLSPASNVNSNASKFSKFCNNSHCASKSVIYKEVISSACCYQSIRTIMLDESKNWS